MTSGVATMFLCLSVFLSPLILHAMKHLVYKILFLLPAIFTVLPIYGEGDDVSKLAARIDEVQGKELYKLSHKVFVRLYEEKSTDRLISYPTTVPADTLRKQVCLEVAFYMFDLPDYSGALHYAHLALEYCRKPADMVNMADLESLISICHIRQSAYEEALHHAETSYKLREQLHDRGGMSSSLANMAAIFLSSRQPEKALPYIKRAISNSTASGDTVRMAIQYGMQSEIYGAMERYDDALESARRAYLIDLEAGHTMRLGTRLAQLGTILLKKNRLDAARDTLQHAISLLEHSDNAHSLAITCTQMGIVLNRQGECRQAVFYLARALSFFTNHHDLYNERNACYALYEALKDTDPQAAMCHLKRYADIRDSLYTQDMQRELAGANARFEVAKAQAESAEKDRNFWIVTAVALAVILVLAVVLFVVARISRHRKQRARHLQDERRQLRRDVEQIREEQRRKDHFYTVLTHDIRTPLTILLGCSASLRRGLATHTCVDADMPDRIERQVDGLLRLVTQLLDLARCQHPTPPTTFCHGDVLPMVNVLAEGFADLARDHRLSLRVEASAETLEMDFSPDYLQKMLLNLLSNAVKNATAGTAVRIDVSGDDDGMIRFRVTNVGPGISEDDLPHLFDMFYCRPNAKGICSSGVGLAIVDRLSKVCGGKVEVESAEPSATVFCLTLPRRQQDVEVVPMVPEDLDEVAEALRSYPLTYSKEEPPHSEGDDAPGSTQPGDAEEYDARPIVLVIEDNPDIFRFLDDALGKEFRMIYAADGKEGLDIAMQVVPNVVMTDLVMPHPDGVEVCRRLKSSDVTSHIPVLVITGRTDRETRLEVTGIGAEAVLTKPFSVEEVAVQLRRVIRQHRILYNCYTSLHPKNHQGRNSMLSQADTEFMERVDSLCITLMATCQLSVEELSRRLGMSTRQFTRKVSALTGRTAIVYITQLRMGRAMKLLKTTELPVNEIMQKCGYDSASNFSNAFKLSVGCSPTVFRRRMHQENKEGEA